MKKFYLFFCVIAAMLFLTGTTCHAQPAIASEYSDTVTITLNGNKEPVTVIRDIMKEEMWYYIPSRLRIARHGKTPAFQFVQFQRKDPKNPEEFIQGGILTMAVNMSLPEDGVEQIIKQISKKYNAGKKKTDKGYKIMRVAPLEMKNGTFTVFDPTTGGKIGEAVQAPKMAPSFPNAEIPIMIKMDALNSDVIKALTTGTGGIPMFIAFKYMGVTPKCGFKVTVDYRTALKQLSTDSKMRASYSSWFTSVSVKSDISSIREKLSKSSSIVIESISGEAFKQEDIDKYLDPILESIMKEVAEVPEPQPEPVAKAQEPGNKKRSWGYSVGVSFALKTVNKVREGKREFNMTRQSQVERATMIGGTVGVGQFLAEIKNKKDREAMKNKLHVMIGEGNWQKAYFMVPSVNGAQESGVTQIDLSVGVVDKKGKYIKQVSKEALKWKAPEDEFSPWLDKKKNERNSLTFGLAEVYDKYGEKARKELQYKMVKKITYRLGKKVKTLKACSIFPIFSGDETPNTPEDDVQPITFYGDYLADNWYGADEDNKNPLKAIVIKTQCKQYDGKSNKTLKQAFTLSAMTDEPPTMLFPTTIKNGKPNPIKGSFKFISKKGKVTIKFKDLLEEYGSDVFFTPDDYEEDKD